MLQEIKYSNATLRIDPRGGYANLFKVNNLHILMPVTHNNDGSTSGGLFPMVPIVNRVRGNALCLHGKKTLLPSVDWDDHFFLHGDSWKKDWKIVGRNENSIQLSLESHISPEIHYLAELSYEISESSLLAVLRVKNLSSFSFPFNIGLHPFFNVNAKSKLCMLHKGYWPEGDSHLPMPYEERVPSKYDFNSEKCLLRGWINHCYTVSVSPITLSHPDLGHRVEIACSTDYVTIYQSSIADGFICIEPQSYPINAHHMMKVPDINPGESQIVKMRISVLSV